MNFSILSWNIQGKRYVTKTRFSKIVPFLKDLNLDIACLQEAHEAGKRLPTLGLFNEFYYVTPRTVRNQNIIISRFPVKASGELVFPGSISSRSLENTTWADINYSGRILRIYNCHFAIVAAGPSCREKQLRFILGHARMHQGPVVICGDLNTTIPSSGVRRVLTQLFHLEPNESMYIDGMRFREDERYPFARIAEQYGFREATDIIKPTWRIAPLPLELFKVKLDWMLVRDIDVEESILCPYISDHRAIYATCSIPQRLLA